ncbi:hypothetical protein HYT53_05990 [Candidatus Woesearchaeota archaeon]|nr:hypothetical protein [Candidatus Woesearchaeota archaeon]
MKNKKSLALPTELIITFVILGLVLLVIVGGGIRGILLPQLAKAGEKSEYATQDCDEDDVVGVSDPCPCVNAVKQKSEKGQTCPPPDNKATTNCPALCKSKQK